MIGKKITAICTGIAAWIVMSAGVSAFEVQKPSVAPQPSVPHIAAPTDSNKLSLDEKAAVSAQEDAKKGIKIPGLGAFTMPKLNFGLDLMYGEGRPEDQSLGFTNDPLVENDVTIMGKVKKRF